MCEASHYMKYTVHHIIQNAFFLSDSWHLNVLLRIKKKYTLILLFHNLKKEGEKRASEHFSSTRGHVARVPTAPWSGGVGLLQQVWQGRGAPLRTDGFSWITRTPFPPTFLSTPRNEVGQSLATQVCLRKDRTAGGREDRTSYLCPHTYPLSSPSVALLGDGGGVLTSRLSLLAELAKQLVSASQPLFTQGICFLLIPASVLAKGQFPPFASNLLHKNIGHFP